MKLAAARARGRDLAALARDYAANPRLGVNLRDGREAVDVVMSSSVAGLPAPARLLFAALGAFASDEIGRRALLSVGRTIWRSPTPRPASTRSSICAWLTPTSPPTCPPTNADNERLRLHPLTRAYARDLLDAERAVGDEPALADGAPRAGPARRRPPGTPATPTTPPPPTPRARSTKRTSAARWPGPSRRRG